LALRKDPHDAFAAVTEELLRNEEAVWQAARALDLYAQRPDRSEAMQSLYLHAYNDSKHLMVRRHAVAGLGYSPRSMAEDARTYILHGLRHDKTAGMAVYAARALVQLDGEAAYPILRRALDTARTAQAASLGLGLLGAKAREALPALEQIAAGAEVEGVDHLTLRREARLAIRRIQADDPSLD